MAPVSQPARPTLVARSTTGRATPTSSHAERDEPAAPAPVDRPRRRSGQSAILVRRKVGMNRKLANQRTMTRRGPGRPALLTAALCLIACAAAGAPAGPPVTTAQPAPTTADGLRGVHYQ